MGDYNHSFTTRIFELVFRLFSLLGITTLGLFIGQFIGFGVAVYLLDFKVQNMADSSKLQQMIMEFLAHPSNYEQGNHAFMAVQWFTALGTFVFSTWAFNKYILKESLSELSGEISPSWHVFLWTALVMIVSMPMLEYIIELNRNIHLPSAYSDVEKMMKEAELLGEKTTKEILHFNSHLDFILGLMTIAFLAALGEEMFFRGVLQNLFERYLLNTHVAIWLAAGIFSFIHFQFYGFFPRLILGAFFGYLYVWYRSIWLPFFAHLFNNATGVIASYLYQLKLIDVNPMDETTNNSIFAVLISLALVVVYIRRLYRFKLAS